MTTITVLAYAKINLYLEVLGRNVNGFHRLETIFQNIGICDEISINIGQSSGIAITCNVPDIPVDNRNLVWRAAELFFGPRLPDMGGINISLRKKIPHGAGLGGGSSDAGAVLRGLNRVFPHFHSADELQKLAASLGSDVPFFLVGGTALGHERGEVLTPLPELASWPVTIMMPDAHVSTPAVFQSLTDTERGPRSEKGVAWWQQQLSGGHFASPLLFNRLTDAAIRLCPDIQVLLNWCHKIQVPCLMSGSGASCFAIGHIEPPASCRFWHTHFITRKTAHSSESNK